MCWSALLGEVLEMEGNLEGVLMVLGPLTPEATPDEDEGDSASDESSDDSSGPPPVLGCLYQAPNENLASCHVPCPISGLHALATKNIC